MAYATVADVQAKWPTPLNAQQVALATVLLDEGSAILRTQVGGLDAGILVGSPDPIVVRKVLTDAVLRVLRNPSGVTTQVVGPESATFSGQAQRAELQFLASELELIQPGPEGSSVGGYAVGSFRFGRPNWCGPGRALDVERWC